MKDPIVRKADKKDLPRLKELFLRSLALEARRDPLIRFSGGDPGPFLEAVMSNPRALFHVAEVDGTLEGYIFGFIQHIRGPLPPPLPRWKKFFTRRRRRDTLIKPFTAVWIEDIYLSRKARKRDVARLFARLVREAALEAGAKRIGGSIAAGNVPARAFAESLGMKPTRSIYSVDIPGKENCPEVPDKRSERRMPMMEEEKDGKKEKGRKGRRKEFVPPLLEVQDEWNIRSRTAGLGGGHIVWGHWQGQGCGGS